MHVQRYVQTVQSEAQFGVAETTHYPAIKALFNGVGDEMKPKVQVVIHPRGSGAGIPDGAVWSAKELKKPDLSGKDPFDLKQIYPDRGGLEAKGLDQDLHQLVKTVQVGKYLNALQQVIVTNLRQFAVVQLRKGEPVIIEEYSLASSKAEFLKLSASQVKAHEKPLTEFLKRALYAKTEIRTPAELAYFLASHAKAAKDTLDSHETLDDLASLKHGLERSLGIQFTGEKGETFFRAELIQTLFYGLFSSWVLWHESNPAKGQEFNFWGASQFLRIPVIDRLFSTAANATLLKRTGLDHHLKNAEEALNRVNREEFFAAFHEGQAVQYFYEPFLAAFDPDLRKQLGVWYTPPEIVQGMVAKCDRLLMSDLDEPDGLAGERVLLLDPCCGTGAYVVEALRVAAERWKARGEPYADKLRKAATQRMFGFELLTGPFVVAHMQVAFLLAQHKTYLSDDERAGIYLTNALTGLASASEQRQILDTTGLQAESTKANEVKSEKDILVVIGNPPYSGYAGVNYSAEELAIVDRYRSSSDRGQGLNDLYVRFYAMAHRRIELSGRGIICFISNYSWLDGLSFGRMRESLLLDFSRIEIDNLHGDRIIGELNPDGQTSETIFAIRGQSDGIKVGIAVGTFVSSSSHKHHRVLYRDFHEAAASDRRVAFKQDRGEYLALNPHPALGRPLRPRAASRAYVTWPTLPQVFPKTLRAVKTSRDNALVDIDKERLESRMRAYFDTRRSDAEVSLIAPDLLDETARFPAQRMRADLLKKGIESGHIEKFYYQPFDVRYLYWHPSKLLDERRPELSEFVFPGNRFLISRAHGERIDEGPPASYTTVKADHHATRPDSACFPMLYFSDESQLTLMAEDHGVKRYNLSSAVTAQLNEIGCTSPEAPFYHVLAILHSPQYIRENAGALRQDWPRVPMRPVDADAKSWLEQGHLLGRTVAGLLDIETAVTGIETGDPRPELRHIAVYNWTGSGAQGRENTSDYDLAAGWGYRGQGGVVMPGNGKTEPNGEGRDVIINEHSRWTNIPDEVWNYHLGGYQVLKKWLSYREAKVLGRPLKLEEVRTFTYIARRIAALIALGPELDAHYRRALEPAT